MNTDTPYTLLFAQRAYCLILQLISRKESQNIRGSSSPVSTHLTTQDTQSHTLNPQNQIWSVWSCNKETTRRLVFEKFAKTNDSKCFNIFVHDIAKTHLGTKRIYRELHKLHMRAGCLSIYPSVFLFGFRFGGPEMAGTGLDRNMPKHVAHRGASFSGYCRPRQKSTGEPRRARTSPGEPGRGKREPRIAQESPGELREPRWAQESPGEPRRAHTSPGQPRQAQESQTSLELRAQSTPEEPSRAQESP